MSWIIVCAAYAVGSYEARRLGQRKRSMDHGGTRVLLRMQRKRRMVFPEAFQIISKDLRRYRLWRSHRSLLMQDRRRFRIVEIHRVEMRSGAGAEVLGRWQTDPADGADGSGSHRSSPQSRLSSPRQLGSASTLSVGPSYAKTCCDMVIFNPTIATRLCDCFLSSPRSH